MYKVCVACLPRHKLRILQMVVKFNGFRTLFLVAAIVYLQEAKHGATIRP